MIIPTRGRRDRRKACGDRSDVKYAMPKISSGFENNTLNLSESKVLIGKNVDIPYFLVGDEIFLLKPWLLQLLKMINNYRHSRARRKENGVTGRTSWLLKLMKLPKGGRRKIVVNELRENLKNFVNSEIGSVPWQLDYVRSVGET